MPNQSVPDHRGRHGYPASPSRQARKPHGQQITGFGRLYIPPAAAKVPRRTPTSGTVARLTRYSRIVPAGAGYRVAVQPILEIPVYGDTTDCGSGRRPSRTGHKPALANATDDTITEPPDPVVARGKP